jgi:protein gp37
MGKETGIQWTDHTFNPWWGCVEVAPECDNCYARTLAERFGFDIWGPNSARRTFGEKHWNEPLVWNRNAMREGMRRRVFSASMADVFEQHPALNEEREKLWELIEQTRNLDWLLLTKRPMNIVKMIPERWLANHFPGNVWLGTSCGHSESIRRVRDLIKVRDAVDAPVLFLSVEPYIKFVPNLMLRKNCPHPRLRGIGFDSCTVKSCSGYEKQIDWVIVGGESGPAARLMESGWVDDALQQCRAAEAAFFFKQAGEALAKLWDCKDKKGGVLEEIPARFRLREFPGSINV